jgi:hypothetical protein
VVGELKDMADVFAPLHTTWSVTVTVAVGLTVMVKVRGVPVQLVPPLLNDGVTVTVAVTGEEPELLAVNAAISPVPLAASPIDGLLFVHE